MSEARTLVLALVSHTNVGKTTLARTLLRRDVGEVFDHAHVTDETETHVLLERPDGARVLLSDTPGFGDSVALLERLRAQEQPLAWLRAQTWDRFTDRAAWCSQQALAHLRDEADLVLYLVNASEDPAAAGYVDPELEILEWVGRPALVLLNQTGAPLDAEAQAADVARWRSHLAGRLLVRDVLHLDAFTRCWLQEGLLLERIRDEIDDAPGRELAQALVDEWAARQRVAFRGSAEALAHWLGSVAADREPLAPDAGRGAVRSATDALQERLEASTADAMERLIELHELTGRAAETLRVQLADFDIPRQPPGRWRSGAMGGAAGGALGGLVGDLTTGGLSLGGGMIAGALLGAAGGSGVSWALRRIRRGTPRLTWSPAFLESHAETVLLHYLLVAHSGRGAGDFRYREPPAAWRSAVTDALAPQRDAIARAFRRAQADDDDDAAREAGLELVAPVTAAARAALLALHPGVTSELP